jgi:acyl-CoA thioesterase-1
MPLRTFPWRACLVLALCCAAGALASVSCGRQRGTDDGATAQAAPAPPPAPAAPDPDAPPARPRIVALGDSLTAGYGLLELQSYPALLQKRIDDDGYEFEVVNAGVSGDTSAGGLRRLDWALDGDARVVIVALGANDGLRGLSVDDMKRNLSAIVERARARGVVVILAGMEAPPNYGQEYAAAFRQAYRELAQKHRVLFIPFLLDGVAGVSTLNQGDGIHPNVQGTAMVADRVWGVLRPVLDQMSSGS